MQSGNLTTLHSTITDILNYHAPFKEKLVRGNNQPHVNGELCKAIMKRSQLKNIANRTKNINDYENYKKQRNFVVHLNRKAKKLFFSKVGKKNCGQNKSFWKTCKPLFSNKTNRTDEKVFLLENKNLIHDDKNVADILNNYFINITSTLPIVKWSDSVCFDINDILKKYKNHPSIIHIRNLGYDPDVFEFSHIYPWETHNVIMSLNPNKSTGGSIPTKILQQIADVCCTPLTDCINSCLLDGIFPSDLKLANVIPVHKSGATTDKKNYRPISLLPVLSKVFEKLFIGPLLA